MLPRYGIARFRIAMLLHSVAQYAEYDFLRDDPRFQNILEECNQILTRDFQSIEA